MSLPVSTVTPKHSIGERVWAKMKGFSPWPAKVVDPTSSQAKKPAGNIKNKTQYCVYFYQSNNYGYILEDAIQSWSEFKDKNLKLCKTKGFLEAVNLCEEDTDQPMALENGTKDVDTKPVAKGRGKREHEEVSDGAAAPAASGDVAKTIVKGEKSPSRPLTTGPIKNYTRKPFEKPGRKPAAAATAVSSGDEDVIVSAAVVPVPKRPRVASKDSVDSKVITKSDVEVAAKKPSDSGKVGRTMLARTQTLLRETGNDVHQDKGISVTAASAKSKSIKASNLKFGFIGLGTMGQRLLKNLLESGHHVTVWNRTPSKIKDFIAMGATKATTPCDVVSTADITFSCLSDPTSVREIVFGNCGVLKDMTNGKGYVELTSIDSETSNDLAEAIISKGGRYMESPLICSGKTQAEEGKLTAIVSGDKSLFDDCHSAFEAITSHSMYLGSQIGQATRMALSVSMLIGNIVGCLAESMALADRAGINNKDLLELLSLSPVNCDTIISKGKAMLEGGFATEMPLMHQQKDLWLAMQLAETLNHPIPITSAANEVYKHAKQLGYADHDSSAVYIRSRF